MVAPRGKRESNRMENLSLFGRSVYLLCQELHVDVTKLAELAQVSKASVSQATRGKARLERESVRKLFAQIQRLAEEQELPLPPEIEADLYHLAGYSVEADVQSGFDHIARFTRYTEPTKPDDNCSIDALNISVPDF